MTRPAAKGWCPGAHRPMPSGDGLLVRVRPHLGRLTAEQVLRLCEAALRHGSGLIDLTSRSNLQLRGITPARHEPLLQDLHQLGLLDADPAVEARRNILCAPLWRDGDETACLAEELTQRLSELPELPAKFGFAVDAGRQRSLVNASADIRIERGTNGGLILRAEGAERGQAVTAESAISAAIALAEWFARTGGLVKGRMARHLHHRRLPLEMQQEHPAQSADALIPGPLVCDAFDTAAVYGVQFGRVPAARLMALMERSGAHALRVTPWRLFLLEGVRVVDVAPFVTAPDDPLLAVDACPGAPACASATVDTRAVARALAGRVKGRLHVSGCAKGCARPHSAETTLVGREGRFDLVREGCAWDAPERSGLLPAALVGGTECL